MGLLRLLLKLFAPTRKAYGYRPTSHSYRQVSAPVHHLPKAPLRQAGEQIGQHIFRGHCWVIDGDTIVINKVNIRLAGIDAPELDHPYGQQAKRALMALCRGQVVTAVTDGSASYERTVATCTLEYGRDLAAEMVKSGLALDWGKHSGGRYRHLDLTVSARSCGVLRRSTGAGCRQQMQRRNARRMPNEGGVRQA